MAWKLHDEFIDLAQARHVVIYRNHDTGAEHHVVHDFSLPSCPHCGHLKVTANGKPIDFQQAKHDTLKALNEHHKKAMSYRELHPHVRLGTTPK